MVKYTYLLFVLLILLTSSCFPIFYGDMLDDNLSIDKKPYTGNNLRIDGYYYSEYNIEENTAIDSHGNHTTENIKRKTILFLYQDGTILYGGDIHSDSILKVEQKYSVQDKLIWGLFNIEGEIIKFEKWYPSSGGPLKSYVKEGLILNDTTFTITRSYRLKKSNKKTEVDRDNKTYHFKQFKTKPNISTVFLKQ